ncbi:RND family efflux transporter MFP subunit [Nonlabens dokdonensis]|uniref:Secretion protein n=2 Tax=Nonlabens dokdonensis TaxID=328515 RepID=L7W776_NONDD|nr:HlyD family efflux transporter periplasmic adaptor subunit [Nonlabens dokdonensis]AGC75984.1 secretion protein [Nonlabens dokdonensis DSW-6]PZX43660.1 RND family efflux transporter MFP subunit [Nonlabens dokdonensis]
MRKVILSILAVILILGAAFGAKMIIDSKTAPKPKVKKDIKIVSTDTIQNTKIPIIIPANGNLEAKKRVELFAEVTGVFRPTGKLFRTGQNYRAGETIILIDNTEFYAQVRSSRSNLNNQITSLMPDLRLDYPESYPQWLDYLNSLDTDRTIPKLPEPKNDKEKYFITGRNIYTTYYNIKNLENRLTKFRITAPFNGILTEAMVSEGTLVRNGQQLGEFIQSGTFEIQVAISADFSDLLEIGKQVELSNISGTKNYTGKVTRINGKVDQSTQTITTVIEVSHPDLKEGMYLTANLQAQEVEKAISIDRSLLQEGNQIFTVEEGKLALTDVTPVHFSDKKVVLKGLKDGTVIIIKSVPGAYEGLIVKTEKQAREEKEKESNDAQSE